MISIVTGREILGGAAESRTVTSKKNVPGGPAGVPVTAPVTEFSVRPGGSEVPFSRAHV